MKMKTSELTGAALDWAVAEANGVHSDIGVNGKPWEPPYSTDWAFGGPIIEREGISIYPDSSNDLPEIKWSADSFDVFRWGGPTPLVAAMRCHVASKLGNEVEIPEELQ